MQCRDVIGLNSLQVRELITVQMISLYRRLSIFEHACAGLQVIVV